jgi:hypothetical protein
VSELLQGEFDLGDLEELEQAPNVIKSAMKIQCSKLNGALPLFDCYVVKKGFTSTCVMVFDFFDFTMKEYLTQFYREDLKSKQGSHLS